MAQKNKILPYIIFGIPAAIAVYIIFKSLKKPKGQDAPPVISPQENTSTTTTSSGGTKPTVSKYFPLKRGSKGAKVTELQNAILAYDKTLLPKFGADGDYGSETEAAVLRLLNKTTVDSQEDINKITQLKATKESLAQAQTANVARNELARNLIEIFNKSSSPEVVLLHPAYMERVRITSDGRTDKDFVWNPAPKGFKLGLKARGVSNVSMGKNNDGFLQIFYSKDGQKYYFAVSPWAVEII